MVRMSGARHLFAGLAKRLQVPTYTEDRVWAEVKVVGVAVKTVR
jgi:PIN domain nuclease of toxin-antitoxin system